MNRQTTKKLTLWLTGILAVLVLAACGTPTDGPPVDDTSTLTVTVNGNGSVTSDVGGLDCTTAGEDTCAVTVDNGTDVALTATPDAEATFTGWAGACTGTDVACVVTVSEDTAVTANFSGAVVTETDYRAAEAAAAGTGPVLHVTVDGGTEMTFPITVMDDDAEEFVSASDNNAEAFPAGFTYTDSSDLDLAYDAGHGTAQFVGLRFPDVSIDPAATIASAFITFTADADDPGNENPVSLTIAGQATATPVAFLNDTDGSPSSNISTRELTSATVNWDITDVWVGGTAYQSADITAIVQEIVDLGDWASGNEMAFVITGGTSAPDPAAE